jgi:hypothetical protein
MLPETELSPLELLKNRIDLSSVPFTERGSRLLVMRNAGGLYIRLAERWVKADPRLSAYRERPPILENMSLLDGDGQPLDFELTSYPHRLDFSTRVGIFTLVFLDSETLLLTLPEDRCGLRFTAHVDTGQIDRRGGILRVTGNIHRNVAYTTNRPILRNHLEPTGRELMEVTLELDAGNAAGLLLNLTPRLGFNRYLPAIEPVLQAAAARWKEWFDAAPPVDPLYREQYYYSWLVMRAGLISTRFYTTREAMTPSKLYYVGVWQWDAYFHALAYRNVDLHLAEDQLRIMLDHQRPDGMIPDAVHDEGTITHLDFPVDADVTKPPLIAWSAWKLFERSGDREFMDEIYEPIVRWNRWWFEYNDTDGDGLCEYQHPYSSGLDDSPLWDGGMPVASPDLNSYLYLQMEKLSQMASLLGMVRDAANWRQSAAQLLDRMQKKMWDPEAGLFWAQRGGKPIKIKTPLSLLPLLTGRLDPAIARRLVENLTDANTFWTTCPVPTVARDEPVYNPMQMWRGPTWVNVNYMLVEGLDRSGYHDIAVQLRQRTLDMLTVSRDIQEYYNPESGSPCQLAAPQFGWSAALFIEMALEDSREKQH